MLLIVAAHATRPRQAHETDAAPGARARFRAWRRSRPFWGGLLTALGGVELFFSGQLDIGKIHVQLGIEGLQATIIPILLVVLGVLVIAMPAHRIFYGVIALAVAVYSLVGVNLGGFFLGMLLSCVGGVLTVAWMPAKAGADTGAAAGGAAEGDDAGADQADGAPGDPGAAESAEELAAERGTADPAGDLAAGQGAADPADDLAAEPHTTHPADAQTAPTDAADPAKGAIA